MTPASAQLTSQPSEGGGEAIHNSTGGGGGGFKPLQAAIAKSAGVVKDRSGALLMRSKSSDRANELNSSQTQTTTVPSSNESSQKKKSVMGAVRGLALGQSVSQPAQSRSSNTTTTSGGGGTIPHAPVRSASTHPSLLPSHSHSHSGTTTPISEPPIRSTSQIHQLSESHVSQISLRMSETVNKIFMPSLHGTQGQQQDKLEGCFFVPTSTVQEATGGKGRPCPRVVKSREFGEMIIS